MKDFLFLGLKVPFFAFQASQGMQRFKGSLLRLSGFAGHAKVQSFRFYRFRGSGFRVDCSI
jgi:hypothetical protein